MKILVINADCIQTNSSANLCHLSYLRGLLEAGHTVSLLSADAQGRTVDPMMQIPAEISAYTFRGMSLYERLSMAKKARADQQVQPNDVPNKSKKLSIRSRIIRTLKKCVLRNYGPYGIYISAVKQRQMFSSDEEYDYILSLSNPTSSHLLAYKLLKKKRIKGKQWIQIWEDPWYGDIYGHSHTPSVRREERKLLSRAQKICYVSPLTLWNQQRLFPDAAHKMYWQPLPYYYISDHAATVSAEENRYGYFGDYVPASRNLEPFYAAAKECGIEVNICGRPHTLFAPTEQIHIYPRLPLDKLKPIEDRTNVLVFLCNRAGGQIPGKIYQYSATQKTILFILDGTEEEQQVLTDFFSPFNRYVFCRNTKEAIAEAIRRIESGDIGNVSNVPLSVFAPKVTIQKILDGGCTQ